MSHTGISTSLGGSVTRVMCHKAVDVEWKIPKFLDLPDEEGKPILSSTFLLCDAEWFIRIYPELCGNVYLDIINERPPRALRASYSAAVLKADGSVFRSVYGIKVFREIGGRVYASDACRIPRSELLTAKDVVLPDGTLTMLVSLCILDQTGEITSVDAACQTAPSDGLQTLSKDFKELFLNRSKGDFSFKVKDRDFLVHKLVLSSRSTVFQAMFETDMVEKNNGTVDILDSDPEHFEQFLLYLYCGDLKVVSLNNALGLYMLADKYNLKELKEACCELLVSEINVNSFFDIAVLAHLHDESKLLNAATAFFIENANAILPTPKWAKLNSEHFTLANEFVIKMASKLLK